MWKPIKTPIFDRWDDLEPVILILIHSSHHLNSAANRQKTLRQRDLFPWSVNRRKAHSVFIFCPLYSASIRQLTCFGNSTWEHRHFSPQENLHHYLAVSHFTSALSVSAVENEYQAVSRFKCLLCIKSLRHKTSLSAVRNVFTSSIHVDATIGERSATPSTRKQEIDLVGTSRGL